MDRKSNPMSNQTKIEEIQEALPSDLASIFDGASIEADEGIQNVILIRPITTDQTEQILDILSSRGYESISIRPLDTTMNGSENSDVISPESSTNSTDQEVKASEDQAIEFDQEVTEIAEAENGAQSLDLDGDQSSENQHQKTPLEVDAEQRLERVHSLRTELGDSLGEQRFKCRLADLEVRRLERTVDQIEKRIEGIESSRESLEEWVFQRRDSFAWQFMAKLEQERTRARDDADSARSQLENGRQRLNQLLVPTYGKPRFAIKAASGLLVTALIVFFIQLLASDTNFFGDLRIPGTVPMAGFAALIYLAALLALWFNSERARASETLRKNHEKRTGSDDLGLDLGQHALMLITMTRNIIVPLPLVIALVFFIEYLATVASPEVARFIPAPLWLWLIALGFWFSSVLVAWWNYYQQLSRLRGLMLRVMHEAKWEQSRYLHAVKEESRLEAMHAMVPEFLELLARVMHEPWKTDSALVESHRSAPPVEVFPASVALAQASRGRGSANAKLIQQAFLSAYQPGWLSVAFHDLLDEANEMEGSLANLVDLESIYSDPGDSLNGPRRRALTGVSSEQVRVAVSREHLPRLAAIIQRYGIRSIKPPVLPLRDGGLGDVQISNTRFRSETGMLESWDEFLARALSPAAPFSLLTFDEMKLNHRPTKIFRSHVLGPEDLLESVPRDQIDVLVQSDDAGSPLDWVVRIDRSDWMDPALLRIFSGVSGEIVGQEVSQEQASQRQILPEG